MVGSTNWLLASLRDAKIAIPAHWEAYSRHVSLMKHGVHTNVDFYSLFLKSIPHTPVPKDLANFKIFVAALGSLLLSIPVTLSLIAIGLDKFFSQKLVLTPTRLMAVRTFFYLFSIKKVSRWRDLVAAEIQSNNLLLRFAGSRNPVEIDLIALSDQDKKTLFQALDELAPTCEFSPEVKNLVPDIMGDTKAGYTLFWEDALRAQRKSTVYMPIPDGAKVGNDRVEIVRQLQGRGWSATYLGRCASEMVVLKESYLSEESSEHQRARDILFRESKILTSLNHQGIVRVIDHFVENDRNYLMLEYTEGRDLRQHVDFQGKLPEGKTVEYALALCDVLQYLHRQEPSIIHRDVTPDNIVITPEEAIKLIDFGASRVFIETATGTMIGKHAYMAPEQLRGKATPKSDVYGFGATLYWLLIGEDPLALSQSAIDHEKHGISASLADLIARMTAFEEQARPDLAEVRKDLESIKIAVKKGTFSVVRDNLSNATKSIVISLKKERDKVIER